MSLYSEVRRTPLGESEMPLSQGGGGGGRIQRKYSPVSEVPAACRFHGLPSAMVSSLCDHYSVIL